MMAESDHAVRVRYAPSPTGLLHLGGARTCLYNWLFARHHGGTFILRIEDTDLARSTPEAKANIIQSMEWLGLHWDEGPQVGGPFAPYVQSERVELYREYARQLVERGAAYPCFCSPERLQAMRKEQEARKQPPGYDRTCRGLTGVEVAAREAEGTRPVIRFKIPDEGTTAFQDLIRGAISFENRTLDDFVMLKSDGFPTYHLANVVDDHLMQITHVIRGEEWISSTPKHLLLYAALEWDHPRFAHLPLILGRDRAKLSKRHGATAVTAYRDQGYLPQALTNFLALLGWASSDDQELFSMEELIRRFTIEAVGRAPAVFDPDKLDWMNGYYIRQSPRERIVRLSLPFLQQAGLVGPSPTPQELSYVTQVVALEQERLKTLAQLPELVEFFFREPHLDPAAVRKWLARDYVPGALRQLSDGLEQVPEWTSPYLEQVLRDLAEEMGRPAADLIHPTRVALSGRTAGPGLFEMMAVLGRDRTLARLERAAAQE